MPEPAAPDPGLPSPMDRLAAKIDHAGAPICVGLDPVLDRIPAPIAGGGGDAPARIERFCMGVLDAVAGIAPAVKPQSACFERYGSAGVAALERVVAHAKGLGLWVVLDVKRGDIGLTAGHYAAAAVAMGADAVTINPSLGRSSITPFLDAGLGAFALVRTSNPDSDELQMAPLESGGVHAHLVARTIASVGRGSRGARGLSALGAVVGATKASDAAALRELMPDQVFLAPGVGAQGGKIDALRPMLRPGATSPGETGVLIPASRSVLYPEQGDGIGVGGWESAIESAARALADEVSALGT